MTQIPHEGLRQLDQYKYHSGGYSKLDNKLNPFWEWVETKVPRTMAPNTVTLIGFFFMAASYFVMLWYDWRFEKALPRWVYLFTAFCQFVYQTLDAVDGKHARTTKCSSPLGQLFDHGCDSFSMTFVILTVAQTARLGSHDELLLFSGLLQLAFFCANWSEYHSGVLTTNVAYFGITEGQYMIISAFVLAGTLGPEALDTSAMDVLNFVGLSFKATGLMDICLNTSIKYIVLRGTYSAVGIILVWFIASTLKAAKDKWLAISQFFPVMFLFATLYYWSSITLFKANPAAVMLSNGLIFSLITCKLIIGSLTKTTITLYQQEVVIFLIIGLLCRFVTPRIGLEKWNEFFLFVTPIYVMISIIIWANSVIFQISSYLGIYCFSLEKRERRKVI